MKYESPNSLCALFQTLKQHQKYDRNMFNLSDALYKMAVSNVGTSELGLHSFFL